MKKFSIRQNYFWGFILILLFMSCAYFLQLHGLNPCPLCMLQRFTMIALSIVFFIGLLGNYNKAMNAILSLLGIMVSIVGMVLAGRQTWLQHSPPVGDGGCGVSLDYLFSILPLQEVLKIVWKGGAECSEIGWVFLKLSLAEWSFICFSVFLVLSLIQLRRGLLS